MLKKRVFLTGLILCGLASSFVVQAQETLAGSWPSTNNSPTVTPTPTSTPQETSDAVDDATSDVGTSEAVSDYAAAPASNNAAAPGDPNYSLPESFYQSQNTTSPETAASTSQAAPVTHDQTRSTRKHKGWHVKSRNKTTTPPAASEPAPEPTPVASSAPVVAEPTPAPVVAESSAPAPTPVPEPAPSADSVPNYSTPVAAPAPVEAAPAPTGNAGYDGGFFIKSDDGNFKWNLNGRIQPRFSVNIAEDIEDQYSFIVRRVLLVMSGNVIDPKLSYELVLVPAATPILGEAILSYAFMDEFAMTIGYQTIPTGHTSMESSGKFQLVDSSLPTSKFNVGDSVGVLFSGTIGKFYYASGVFNGAATDLARNQNSEMAYGLQLVFNVFGAYGGGESDLKDSQDPNWVIDLAGNFHHEESGTQSKVIHGTAFTGVKWHGFGALIEGNIRYIDPDEFTREQVDAGYTIQAGYFVIPTKLEFALRHSALLDDINDVGINQNMTAGNIGNLDGPHVGADVGGDSDNEYEFSGAVSYYFKGNNIKLQAHYSYILDGVPGPDDETYHIGIIQGQVGF